MFFLRRQVKKCKIHKKLKLRMNEDGVKCQIGTELSGVFKTGKEQEKTNPNGKKGGFILKIWEG